jgi:putative membrane-bound dehydrogenase-like protein
MRIPAAMIFRRFPAAYLIALTTMSPLLHGAEVPTAKVDLLQSVKSGGVTYFVSQKQTLKDSPEQIWTFGEEGQLKISGRGFGYLATKADYKDYHLVIEYKFPGPTMGSRENKARDNGVLVHGHGPEGSVGGTWLASIEAQIIEGGTGDILVLPGKAEDGALVPTTMTGEFVKDRDGELVWQRGAEKLPMGADGKPKRLNWAKRDPDWVDKAGFYGKNDVQSKFHEWTRMEVVAQGDKLTYYVNGVEVNEALECKPAEGRICLQTEGAEMLVRRFELHPLGKFKETWNPASASGGTNVPVRKSRESAWSPEETRKSIELDGPYEVELVAAEPLVKDPVEVCWDAQGRMFVADMIDYPLGAGPGKPPLSRIQCLYDDDQDGKYDRAVTFAPEVDHVQGLAPHKDGLIATTRTQILFLRDTNGDGVADERKPLVEGFNPNHSQLQVSSPRWGLDGHLYFNNGLDTKEIYPAESPERKLNFTRTNLKWNPLSGLFKPASGYGQFGGSFDDWGRHFFCSNRNPVMFAVMPYEAVMRNANAGIASGSEDVGPFGAETRVYPLMLSHTTADAHAGTHTAACGLGVYRGDLMPELKGEVFVPDPTGQLMVRYHLEPKGASFKAARVGEHTDFFRSRDEWCRPVNVTTGPDGAMYVCDIYRRYIDHARFFPEEFAKTHDMRQGENEGRIWRVVPKGGKKLRKIESAPKEVEGLVAWLGHENAWQRETAQRVLLEKKKEELKGFWEAVAKQKPTELFRLHIQALHSITLSHYSDRLGLSGLDGQDAAMGKFFEAEPTARIEELSASFIVPVHDEVTLTPAAMDQVEVDGRAAFMQILTGGQSPQAMAADAGRFPGDVWINRAILSESKGESGGVLAQVLKGPLAASYSSETADFVRALASASAADAQLEDFASLLGVLSEQPGKLLWWKPAVLQGLSEGLPKSGKKLGVSTLAELAAKPPASYVVAAREISALLAEVDRVMMDGAAPVEQRLAVLPLLAQRSWEKAEPVLRTLLSEGQPEAVRTAALPLLKKYGADKTSPLLYELLPRLGPGAKREVVAMLTGNGKTVQGFFERIERGEISKGLVDAETRWRYLHTASKPLRELAERLFGRPSEDRAAVIASYKDCISMQGDAAKGKVVFMTVCMVCHKVKGEGMDVGPDITDVKLKEKEALLSDILDPNRMVEARWSAYQIDTREGRIVSGLIASESADAVTVKMAGGITEVLPRGTISKMKSLDASLMPVGLEGGISKEQMADLLAFLKGEGK